MVRTAVRIRKLELDITGNGIAARRVGRGQTDMKRGERELLKWLAEMKRINPNKLESTLESVRWFFTARSAAKEVRRKVLAELGRDKSGRAAGE